MGRPGIVLEISLKPDAQRALLKHRARADLIEAKIRAYAADPASQSNNVKRLKGAPVRYRLRVGDFRVVFDVADNIMTVFDIGPRGDVYD